MTAKRTLAATCILSLLATGAVIADENKGGFSKAIEYRSGVMNVFKWNMGPMGAMMKGEMPFEAESFAKHAKDLNAAAHLDLLSGFPEGSEEGETDARADIWIDFEGFTQKYNTLKQEAAKLADISATGDMEATKTQFGAVGKACKSCHDAFKD